MASNDIAHGAASFHDDAWLTAQKNAFQAAMNGEPLDSSLGILTRVARNLVPGNPRCAFFIGDGDGGLPHVIGMGADYARHAGGFLNSKDSLDFGLAVATGEPVITPDVHEEPRWKPSTWLSDQHSCRACWSFPLETAKGKLIGSFALYFSQRREPTAFDREIAARLTHAAAILVSHHQESAERARAEVALRTSEERQAFMLRLSDTLRSLSDPIVIQEAAMALVARHLRVDRAAYFEVDAD